MEKLLTTVESDYHKHHLMRQEIQKTNQVFRKANSTNIGPIAATNGEMILNN